MEENNVNKRKKTGLIIAIIGVLLIIGSFVYLFLGTDMFKSKKESKEDKENKEDVKNKDENKKFNYNGIYENDGVIVKIFDKKDLRSQELTKFFNVEFVIEANGWSIGAAFDDDDIINNKATASFFDNEITIEFKNNEIEVTGNEATINNNQGFKNGVYKKTGDYKTEDYFRDNIGDPSLINSIYNGKYNLDGKIVYMYQIEENRVKIVLIDNSPNSSFFYSNYFTIENGVLTEEVYGDDEIKTTITFDGNNLILMDIENQNISGTYVKEKNLTIDEIISLE